MAAPRARLVGLRARGIASVNSDSQLTANNRILNETTHPTLADSKMALTITSLRVDGRETEGWFEGGTRPCPYLIVNCVFKCDRSEDLHEDFAWNQAKAWSEDYRQVLTIDDPERYERWLMGDGWDFRTSYNGYGKAWTHDDPPWRYIEKFDSFHFREWIADCGPTRAVIAELEYYKEHGCLPSVYRTVESSIILSHLRTLSEYWD